MSTQPFPTSEIEAFVDESVGVPVEVSDRAIKICQETREFGGLSFELLKEATRLMCAVIDYRSATEGELGLARNQAVCTGLIVRMSKMMVSILKLSSDHEHGETVLVLSRCMFESSINLRYLLQQKSTPLYERFVKVGLKGERVLYDLIKSNISQRGGPMLGIEASMLTSIEATCARSGVDIGDVNARAGEWGGSLRDKLNSLGIPDSAYSVQSIASQSVHGSWSDLILNHLTSAGTGYSVNADHKQTDGKFLGPVALFALVAAIPYVDASFSSGESEPFRRRLDDLLVRLQKLEHARPGWELSSDQ